MAKLWQIDRDLDDCVEEYTVGADPQLDARLLPYEVFGTIAHSAGLVRAGVLSRKEFRSIRDALKALLDQSSGFRIRRSQEDIHTAVEQYLTRRLGPAGAKVHAGRSRNDQIQVDLRLFIKDRLLDHCRLALQAARNLNRFGKKHQGVLLPGYTHMQRAMPTTVGHWAAAHAEGLVEGIADLRQAFERADSSPLGSAAGYGVPLEIDRGYTAKLLGFGRVERNTLRVQTSRPRLEAAVVSALALLARDLGVLASDAILYCTSEFGFFRLSAGFTTGSSIMPQKRNPDVLELTRARAALFPGWLNQILELSRLPSGYHRDYQLTKQPLFAALDNCSQMLRIAGRLPAALQVREERCRAAVDAAMLATQQALALVAGGMPFREAYRRTARTTRGRTAGQPPAQDIRLAGYPGAPGNPDFEGIGRDLRSHAGWQRKTRRSLDNAWQKLLSLDR